VIAIGENLPFKDQTIQNTLTCFALRDARNLEQSLAEFHRSMKNQAQLCIVDIGKPDRAFQKIVITLYIQRLMPLLARLLVRNRIPSNPFKMIVPTFKKLSTNRSLTSEVETSFGPSRLEEFMQGGLILLAAERGNPRIAIAQTGRLPKYGNPPKYSNG
jgi:ubiquinone/menaquinone biosynthesis C-methylase UbiE